MTEPVEAEHTPIESATGWVPQFDGIVAAGDDHLEPGALVARPVAVLDETPPELSDNDTVQRLDGEDRVGEDRDEKDRVERDWAWVEEWRSGGEPTPWGPGLVLAAFGASIVGIAIYVITAGLIDRPILAVVANVVIAGGLSPALYMARTLPVLRWVSLGGAIGAVLAWVAVLFFPVVTGT